MFKTGKLPSNIFIFLTGALSVIALLLLTGVASHSPVGKYEMEVITTNGKITNVYVIDTTNGRVKWLDSLNVPFEQLKGD